MTGSLNSSIRSFLTPEAHTHRYTYTLTPPQDTKFEQISPDVDVEDTYEQQVEVEALNGEPGEQAQLGIVCKRRHGNTDFWDSQGRQEVVDEEAEV